MDADTVEDYLTSWSCCLCHKLESTEQCTNLHEQHFILETRLLIGVNYELFFRCPDCGGVFHAACVGLVPSEIVQAALTFMCKGCSD